MENYVAQPVWVILLTLLGFISIAKFSISLIRFIYVYFLRPAKNLKSRYGSWAVVTGATDGIGEALAFQLAHQGLHLVLVGRNPDKLRAVTNALCQEYPTAKIKTVVFDLAADDTKAGLRRLREEIEGLDVGVLINNAGVYDGYGTMFDEAEIKTWMNVIRVNVRSLTEVTHAVLPGMLVPPFSLCAVYTGTKAFIDVQCQHPSLVATRRVSDNIKLKGYDLFTAPLDPYARASLRWIGYKAACLPYLPHFIEVVIIGLIPNFICNGPILRANLRPRKSKSG